MPEPRAQPGGLEVRRVAFHALLAGLAITGLKFGIFALTNSAAVLSDALESIINLAAAAMMLYSLWLANRPADREHPYGHGKIEFMAVGLEGWMILLAGVVIAYQSVTRLFRTPEFNPTHLYWGTWALGGVAALAGALGVYVLLAGRRHGSATLIADGKHLLTDVLSTLGGIAGLVLVQYTGKPWVDPVVALVLAGVILFTSWRLLWQSIDGLMDRIDPRDEALIHGILDEELQRGTIRGYHKVRHRHNGAFHWVDMHLQVEPRMSVRDGHAVASRIEHRIETALGQANATAHVEPYEPDAAAPAGPVAAATGAAPSVSPPPAPSWSAPPDDAEADEPILMGELADDSPADAADGEDASPPAVPLRDEAHDPRRPPTYDIAPHPDA